MSTPSASPGRPPRPSLPIAVLGLFIAGLGSPANAGQLQWGDFGAEQCIGAGVRRYSAILWGIPWGTSWEDACRAMPADIHGSHFNAPTSCVRAAFYMWGGFDVSDEGCKPGWGELTKDECTAPGKRQYSSLLKELPKGVSVESACAQLGVTVAGTAFSKQTRCKSDKTGTWGQFEVDDSSCGPSGWDAFQKEHCLDSGKRLYSSVLRYVPAGPGGEQTCAIWPATVQGWSFPGPSRCKTDQGNVRGEFDVPDPTCSPSTECSDSSVPAGAFEKRGNDGSRSCDAYCANLGGTWGPPGTCAKGRLESGPNAGACLRCVEAGRSFGATGVTCYCTAQATGFADVHNHQFANLAFGGKAVWGSPFGPIEQALPWCTPVHGPGGIDDLMFGLARKTSLSVAISDANPTLPSSMLDRVAVDAHAEVGHPVGGYPAFDGWPDFKSTSHQGMYEDWLARAVQGGLRLMVMFAVNNEEVCAAANNLKGRTCDDAEAIRYQIEAETNGAKAMERAIDEKNGGPGKGWYRIVYTPRQAREAIAQNKLAVVLGAEVDFFLNCRKEGDCTLENVRSGIAKYRELGLRHIFPIHFASNGFGGAGLNNPLTHGEERDCGAEGYTYRHWTLSRVLRSRTPTCNKLGLTGLGKATLEELIQSKMVIDIDHLSVLARADALAIFEKHHYPPISSHTGFVDMGLGSKKHEANLKPDEMQRVKALGGMISIIMSAGESLDDTATFRGEGLPAVELQCGLSSQNFAQHYLYAVKQLGGVPVGIGTDFNAGPLQPGPRFGSEACRGGGPTHPQTARVSYPFPVSVKGSPSGLDKSVVGPRVFDFNVDGMAHIGLLPDFIEDLKQQGVRPQDLEPLLNSAEGYIRLWEQIESR